MNEPIGASKEEDDEDDEYDVDFVDDEEEFIPLLEDDLEERSVHYIKFDLVEKRNLIMPSLTPPYF